MIITRLLGGLGNQMFQYAAGRRLAHGRNVSLKLDISWMQKFNSRPYVLNNFNIEESFASQSEIAAIAPTGKLGHAIAKRLPGLRPHYIQEKYFHFDPEILKLPDGVYLKGNWQSPKYFADIAEIIRNEFTLKKRLTEKSLRLAELIDSNESVSIHVRRGDYAQTSNGLQHHGVCGEDYYCRCVDHIRQGVKHPQFFIFSDDPSWAADNFGHLEGSVFVDNDSHDACQDLWLMSHCKHNIIANSTFSWWGAWLNRHEGKIVLAPKQWFAEEVQFSMRTEDLFPSEWIAI